MPKTILSLTTHGGVTDRFPIVTLRIRLGDGTITSDSLASLRAQNNGGPIGLVLLPRKDANLLDLLHRIQYLAPLIKRIHGLSGRGSNLPLIQTNTQHLGADLGVSKGGGICLENPLQRKILISGGDREQQIAHLVSSNPSLMLP